MFGQKPKPTLEERVSKLEELDRRLVKMRKPLTDKVATLRTLNRLLIESDNRCLSLARQLNQEEKERESLRRKCNSALLEVNRAEIAYDAEFVGLVGEFGLGSTD